MAGEPAFLFLRGGRLLVKDRLRAYPRIPDRGIRVRWGQIWADRTERAAGVVGAYVEDWRRRTGRRWPQMARRPTGGVLG